MKKFLLLFVTVSISHSLLFAQSDDALTEEIQNLEQQEMNAILFQDYEILSRLWAKDFMVNNPANTVLKSRDEVFLRMNQGIIHYSEYNRQIEAVLVMDGIVIVMGEETVKPMGVAPMTGKTVKRRYTNFWREINGKWQVQARHANVIGME